MIYLQYIVSIALVIFAIVYIFNLGKNTFSGSSDKEGCDKCSK